MADTETIAYGEPSIEATIVALQNAIEKLKLGFDDFEFELRKVRTRTPKEHCMQNWHEEGGKLLDELARDNRSMRSEGYIPIVNQTRPSSPSQETKRFGLKSFWKDRIGAEMRDQCRLRLERHKEECLKFAKELEHFQGHLNHIGGVKKVKETSKFLMGKVMAICDPLKALIGYEMEKGSSERESVTLSVSNMYSEISNAVSAFEDSLYEQRHAFYFRRVREWQDYSNKNLKRLDSLQGSSHYEEMVHYIFVDVLDDFENCMVKVADELCRFGERALPMFLADEKERATTRYLNITTIATFFSSVTATTLQISISITESSTLYNVVNLFWFVSLVFSVSSGASSLLGMTWRKSSIYDTTTPPWLAELWLEKAPMLFLVVSAMMFIVGLNLFAYLSSQASYVSFLTNAFTGVHSLCLFAVVVWFIYRLNHESALVEWTESVLSQWRADLGKSLSLLYKGDRSRHYQRNVCFALGLDKRVLQLNCDLRWSRKWPSSPNKIMKAIESAGFSVKSLLRRLKCRRATENREVDLESTTEIEDTVEEALNKYSQALRKTFGDSRGIGEVTGEVKFWMEVNWGNMDDLKWRLDPLLWGYPHLVDIAFSELVNALGRIRTQLRDASLTNTNSGKEAPSSSRPPVHSAVIWAHAKAEDVNPESLKEGPGWYALFNPGVERSLDVSLVHTLRHNSNVHCVRFSADGRYLAVGGNDGAAQIYDVDAGAQKCTLCEDIPQGPLYGICFSPDGNYLATAGKDRQIRVWDIDSKNVQYNLKGHQEFITALNYSRDGRFIVSGSFDGTARIWYPDTGDSTVLKYNDTEGAGNAVWCITISHDGKSIAGGCSDGLIHIWEVQTGHLFKSLSGHRNWVVSVAFTPDDKGLISGGADKTVKHWDLAPLLRCDSRTEPLPLPTSTIPLCASGTSPCGTPHEQGPGERGSICTLTFDGHKDWVRSVAVNHSGQWVFSGSDDRSVLVREAQNAQIQLALHGHDNWATSVDVSPTESGVFASGSNDRTTKIWKYKCIKNLV